MEPCTHGSYAYTIIDESKHTARCIYCDNTADENHVASGTCPCGYEVDVATISLTDGSDNSEVLTKYDGLTVNATYNRVFSAIDNGDGTWTSRAYTVCLPYTYDIPMEAVANGDVRVYTLMSVDTETNAFIFTNDFGTLRAGEPYVIVLNKGALSLNADGVELRAQPKEGVKVNRKGTGEQIGWWRGTFSTISNDECSERNIYMQQSTGKFRLAHNEPEKFKVMYLNPFRCFFEPLASLNVEQYSQKFVHTENGEEDGEITEFPSGSFEGDNDPVDPETGIMPTIRTIDSDGTVRLFDLLGRPLDKKPAKGLYIENNKIKFNK